MNDANLGQLIDETAQRDAIHVAIAPVVAGEVLEPGERIGLGVNGLACRMGASNIGIVDPFLTGPVMDGQRFYMVLCPRSITSLRHEWTHPAFPKSILPPDGSKEESELWLRMYAKKVNYYDDAETAFKDLVEGLRTGDLRFHGTDLYSTGDLEQADELKLHAERYLGIAIDYDNFTFSCSC